MKLLIEREQLLTPLNTVTSVVERRQTLPILANVLMQLENNILTLVVPIWKWKPVFKRLP